MANLPALRPDLRDFEKAAGISVDVIVRLKNSEHKTIGRYIHGVTEWQVNGWTGSPEVVEWWPLPETGTGEGA